MLKICTKCHISQTLDYFSKKFDTRDGYRSTCKQCNKEYKKQHNKENKDKISTKKKHYYEENTELIAIRNKQYKESNKVEVIVKQKLYNKSPMGRAVRLNTGHKRRTLTRQGDVTTVQLLELTQNATHCFWCNIPLFNIKPHIDHFQPISRGGIHTLSNIVVACPTCNMRKGAKDPLEFARSIGKIL